MHENEKCPGCERSVSEPLYGDLHKTVDSDGRTWHMLCWNLHVRETATIVEYSVKSPFRVYVP